MKAGDLIMYEEFNLVDGTPIKHVELMSSAAHTYGNAIAFIENWLINLFPEDFFKTIHVNSKIAHQQIRNTPHEYNKKLKPIFAISPRVDLDDSRFLEGTPLIQRRSDLYSNLRLSNLMPFFSDPEKKIAIKYQLNRTVMYADVILIFNTKMEQLNYASYLQNATMFDIPMDLRSCFESYLAPELIEMISNTVGIPVYDDNGTTYTFLKYMNSHSQFPITHKLQGEKGKKEFYRYYPVTIDTLLNNLNYDDGDKIGQITTNYRVTFTVRMEFFSTGFYYLFSNECVPIKQRNLNSSEVIIPNYTDVLLKEDLHLENGWDLFTNVSFQLDKPNDEIAFDEIINISIKEAIKYHIKNSMPLLDLIDIKIRKQGHLLFEGKDYTIDYENYIIKFNNSDYKYYTYSMYISINVEYLNTLIKQIFGLK